MHTAVLVSIFSLSGPRRVHRPKETPRPPGSAPCSPPPALLPPACFLAMGLPTLHMSHKQNCTACDLCVWLLSRACFQGSAPVAGGRAPSLFHGQVTFHGGWIASFLLMYVSVCGHSGNSDPLAVMKRAAVNVPSHRSCVSPCSTWEWNC